MKEDYFLTFHIFVLRADLFDLSDFNQLTFRVHGIPTTVAEFHILSNGIVLEVFTYIL